MDRADNRLDDTLRPEKVSYERYRLAAFSQGQGRLCEEIDTHLLMAIADPGARGEPLETAYEATMHEFGNQPLVEDVTQSMLRLSWLESLLQDFRFALRQIRRSRVFAATVIGTLALGIAATAAMFTVIDHVLLRPVSYNNPARVIAILAGEGREASGQYLVPWLDIREWRNRSHSFTQIAFWGRMGARNYLEETTSALQVDGIRVSPNLFPTLGVEPWLGRGFLPRTPDYASDENSQSIVLSYSIWMTAFDGDKGVLGHVVTINNTSFTVIGVMPPGFYFPVGDKSAGQIWAAAELGTEDQSRLITAMKYEAVGRLRNGQTLESARVELQAIQRAIAPQYTDPRLRDEHSKVTLRPYSDSLVPRDLRKALLALLAASAVLWLIASFNATNLMLARITARQREIAIRGALGASRSRVAQQMIAEAVVLCGASAVLGTCIAAGSLKLLEHALRSHLPIAVPAVPNIPVLVALIGLTILSAVVSAAWPTLIAVQAPIEPVLKKDGMQTGASRHQQQVRSALVALEMALSLMLLVTCGLLLRTIYALRHVPLGFRTDHIVVANLSIPSFRFAGRDMDSVVYQPLLDRVKHMPGVQSAGLMTEVPLGQTFALKLLLRANGQKAPTYLKAVSPGVQDVFGFRMAGGRFFGPEDTPTSQTALVVNQAFARLYSPNSHNPEEILGKQLFSSDRESQSGQSAVVVGVLFDERQESVSESAQPEIDIYLPQIKFGSMFYRSAEGVAIDLAVRTNAPTAEMIPALRKVLRQASPELATATITTMDQIVADSYGDQTFAAHLLELFGGAALLLSLAGMYGLLTYTVIQRRREIGVRVALGARRGDLLWLVLRQAGEMLLVGIVAGSGLAFASARLVRAYLYGVSAHDGWTLSGSAIIMFVAAMLAAYVPARRATRVDPIEALRAE